MLKETKIPRFIGIYENKTKKNMNIFKEENIVQVIENEIDGDLQKLFKLNE